MTNPIIVRLSGWFVLILLQIPLVMTFWASFSADSLLTLPTTRWSMRWYVDFIYEPQWSRAAFRSLIAACVAAGIAVPLATAAAWSLREWPQRFRYYVLGALLMPATVSGVALGLGLLQVAYAVGLAGQWPCLIGAHTLLGFPVALLVVRMGFTPSLQQLEAAAAGLGANPSVVAWRITLPLLWPWLVASAVAVFVISLNDAVVAVFVCGPDTETLPVVAWRQLRHSAGPMVAVAGTITMVASLGMMGVTTAGLWYLRFRKQSAGGPL